MKALVIILNLGAALTLTSVHASVEFTAGEGRLLPMLHADDMEAVHAQAKEILSKCKLPECKIVSLGITNTLIDSFLRYYLKGDAERAIHYVPLRNLSLAVTLPAGIERSLPKSTPDLKRVVIVRTLEKGLSISSFAREVKKYFGEAGAPYAIEAYFSTADPDIEDSNQLSQFPWPFQIKKLQNSSAISGAYRKIDGKYYRFLPFSYDPSAFWRANRMDPRVADFRERVERSVGINFSRGHSLFLTTEAVKKAWTTALSGEPSATYATFLRLKHLLPYGDARDTYAYELKALENQLLAELQYWENRDYKVLDRAVSLFIEDPETFTQKQCAAHMLN